MSDRDRKIMITASEGFLCNPLPDNWHELDGPDLDQFIRDNAWGPLEDWEPGEVWETIEAMAETINELFKELLV
jgi:hypothetical protein